MPRRTVGPPSEKMKAAAEQVIRDLELSVRFIVTDYSVEFVTEKIRQEEYYVPEYQREMVWDDAVQSRYIESVLIGLPIPFVFLWQDDEGKMEIVDGSQRIRTLRRFADDELKLGKLQLLPEVNGFRFSDLSESRRRKFNARTLRGIVLENATTTATRTEMFARINTGGRSANDAEIRRGSLPGAFTDLVIHCADQPSFVQLTPISQRLINGREREELVVRFFTFLEGFDVPAQDVPGWKDRPREYIFVFVEQANKHALKDSGFIGRLQKDFDQMVDFVAGSFPNGFRKAPQAKQVPRARYEAIAVGTGLALRQRPDLLNRPLQQIEWAADSEFFKVTTSDAANVRSKLIGRIEFVRGRLVER